MKNIHTRVPLILGFVLLASCSSPEPVTEYERHLISVEEYLAYKNLTNATHEELREMWRTVYLEAQIKMEVK
tara:strand:+ start:248 stop:463 length:216 start_codon:yes stop_codon:yes gene_type:complete